MSISVTSGLRGSAVRRRSRPLGAGSSATRRSLPLRRSTVAFAVAADGLFFASFFMAADYRGANGRTHRSENGEWRARMLPIIAA